jgi:hypothetical protein
MKSRKKLSARKATWLAFGLIALAGVSSAQTEPLQETIYGLSDVSRHSPVFILPGLPTAFSPPDAISRLHGAEPAIRQQEYSKSITALL